MSWLLTVKTSYRVTTDQTSAKFLWMQLQMAQFHAYIDEECLQPGKTFETDFMGGLKRSRVIILLISHASIQRFMNADNFPGDNVLLEVI